MEREKENGQIGIIRFIYRDTYLQLEELIRFYLRKNINYTYTHTHAIFLFLSDLRINKRKREKEEERKRESERKRKLFQ